MVQFYFGLTPILRGFSLFFEVPMIFFRNKLLPLGLIGAIPNQLQMAIFPQMTAFFKTGF